jgi:glyoxylase-like metal-dependent hydrolase (beta-lactamase superfamily II)
VTVLPDGAELRAGSRTLQALHTPGHASHHIAFHDPERHTAFTGDVGGVRVQGASYVRPPTPPPDIDVESWHASVERLRALKLEAIDLAHFGRFHDPGRHFDELLRHLDSWTAWTAERLAEGTEREQLAREFKALTQGELFAVVSSDELRVAYEWASPSYMMIDGIVRYLGTRSV